MGRFYGKTVRNFRLKDRIKEAMEGAGLKKLQFANKVGVSSGAVTQWITGQTKSLKADTASRMEIATGYRAEWIVTGRGNKRASQAVQQSGLNQAVTPVQEQTATDPLRSLRSVYDEVPVEFRRRALHAALMSLAEWVSPETNSVYRTSQGCLQIAMKTADVR